MEIVERLIERVDDTKSVAADSLVMLPKQREQLERIDKEVDHLGSNVTRGMNEMKVLIFVIGLVVLILLLILWRIITF